MTPQETFDTVVKHLITQGKPALTEEGDCAYRVAETDLTCAVGCLIPDEFYSTAMEEKTAEQLLIKFPHLRPILGDNTSLLMDLQAVHDGVGLHPQNTTFGWDKDRCGEATELLKSVKNENDDTFNIPALKRALTFVAWKHNLSPEAI